MKSTVAPYQTSATCVRIECLNGVTVRLTDYPYDLVMSNAAVYKTDYGYQPTAFTASSAFSPSAIDIDGICAVGGVTRDQLASGVFDNARVYIFKCNFLAPVEDYDTDLSDDAIAALDARAEEIIGASRPAELRPHIKAGTAWGEPL